MDVTVKSASHKIRCQLPSLPVALYMWCVHSSTVEPPNSVHTGISHFVLYREVVPSSEECTSTIEKGPKGVSFMDFIFYCVLYSECPLSEVPLCIHTWHDV